MKGYLGSSLFISYLLLFTEHTVTPFDSNLEKLAVILFSFMSKN